MKDLNMTDIPEVAHYNGIKLRDIYEMNDIQIEVMKDYFISERKKKNRYIKLLKKKLVKLSR